MKLVCTHCGKKLSEGIAQMIDPLYPNGGRG